MKKETFPQVDDFKAECDALHSLLAELDDASFNEATQFKAWTLNDVIGHLHVWNIAADLSLAGADKFIEFFDGFKRYAGVERPMRKFETDLLDGLCGRVLLSAWQEQYQEMCERFGNADPKSRVVWAGPDMSVRSSISARLMETWAHGQEAYDHFGVTRIDGDRIKNIVILGMNTFAWTFKVNGLDIPKHVPRVKLEAPSGEIWCFGDEVSDELIEGTATQFCQVVTQVRNIADTSLKVSGPVAQQWMSMAQCFAGEAETPPAPGTRFTQLTPTQHKAELA